MAREFGGETYNEGRDRDRLHAQLVRVYKLMRDGHWRTLRNISSQTGDPEASVSARLRDLRKERFGGHVVRRMYIDNGMWKYRLIVRKDDHVQWRWRFNSPGILEKPDQGRVP